MKVKRWVIPDTNFRPPRVLTHVYTHTQHTLTPLTHLYIHTFTHACIHIYSCTHALTHVFTPTTHVYAHALTHMYTHGVGRVQCRELPEVNLWPLHSPAHLYSTHYTYTHIHTVYRLLLPTKTLWVSVSVSLSFL